MHRDPSTADGGRAGRRGAALALALALFALPAGAQQGGGPPGGGGPGGRPSGPTEVGVIELAAEQVPYTLTLPGRAVAFEEADIRPRVSGIIAEVAYRPGQPVAAGDLLFRIEDDSIAATVAAAEATRAGAEAAVATAQATVDRYRSLEGSAITRAELETAEAALSQARAQLASAEAQLTSARLDLDRTAIRSPIAGIPSVAAVSTGELVTASQAEALATVTRLDPIYVDVTESSARMLRIRERIDQGSLSPGDEIGFRLVLETGAVLEGEGTLVTSASSVSTTTGTVDVRIEFANPRGDVLPGQFLRVEVTLGTSEGILVPQRATSRAPNGALTAFVAGEGAAREVTLTSTGTWRNAWVVTEGLEPGDRLIVDGLNNLRDGAEITTVPVEIDEQGVVRDLAPESPEGEEAAPETAGAASSGTTGTETRAEASSGPAAPPAAAPATVRE